MASFTLRTATFPSSQLSVTKRSSSELAATNHNPFQVSCMGDSEHEAPKTVSLSRRDALITFTSLSATAIDVCSPESAEARITKAEMRRKIKEKLEMLREKAGLSKQKGNDKKNFPPVPPPSSKEKNVLPFEPPPFPLPTPPNHNKSLVEASFE